MGNCLSKYPMKIEIGSFKEGRSKSTGLKAEAQARSLGYYFVNRTTILTPINDRFPAQAFDLEVSKFSGFSEPKTANKTIFRSMKRE